MAALCFFAVPLQPYLLHIKIGASFYCFVSLHFQLSIAFPSVMLGLNENLIGASYLPLVADERGRFVLFNVLPKRVNHHQGLSAGRRQSTFFRSSKSPLFHGSGSGAPLEGKLSISC